MEGKSDINTLFPVFLKLAKLRLLLVGGGNVALEKLGALLDNCPDAVIKVVAKEISPAVRALLESRSLEWEEREFQPSDLEGIDLAIIAINEKSASHSIHQSCKKKGILTNVADTPDYCDFYLGSIVQKGNLKIAISTNGKSPTIAKRVKEVLNETFPPEMDQVLDNMEKIRNRIAGDFSDKVRELNSITSVLSTQQPKPQTGSARGSTTVWLLVATFIVAMVVGYMIAIALFSR